MARSFAAPYRRPFTYVIVGVAGDDPLVLGHEGIDPDLSEIAGALLTKLSTQCRRRYATAILDLLNWPRAILEGDHYLFTADQAQGRGLAEQCFKDWGCRVSAASNNYEAFLAVRPLAQKDAAIQLRISLLRRMFSLAAFRSMRTCKKGVLTTDRFNAAQTANSYGRPTIMDSEGNARVLVGNYFRIAERATTSPNLYDASKLPGTVVDAMIAANCPASVVNVVRACGSSGRRYSDFIGATLLDWAKASTFGRSVWTTCKGYKGKLAGKATIDESCRLAIAADIDARHLANPRSPTMAQARLMWNDGRPTKADRRRLSETALFAGSSGKPPSYSWFRAKWFASAVEGIEIHGPDGSTAFTFHWLRRAYVHTRLEKIYSRGLSREQINAEREKLQDYMCWKTNQIRRYAAFFEHDRIAREEQEYQDARDASDFVDPDDARLMSAEDEEASRLFGTQPL